MTSIKKAACSGLEEFIHTAQRKEKLPYDLYIPWQDEDNENFSIPSGSGSPRFLSLKPLQSFPKGHALHGCVIYTGPDTLCIYAGNILTGICTVFSYENDGKLIHELYCLVHPDHQRHGIGTALIRLGVQHLCVRGSLPPSSRSIYLVGSNAVFAERLGCHFSHSEHFMHYKDNIPDSTAKDTKSPEPDTDSLRRPEGEDSISFISAPLSQNSRQFSVQKDGAVLCRCQADEFEGYVNISHVFTEEAFRGRGLATLLMKHIISQYPGRELLLQAAGKNIPAIRAYRKAGFTFLQTTEYYLYED